MGAFGSPEYVPAPEPQYEIYYCKHCQCNVHGHYCSICGRALSKKAKWKIFRLNMLGVILGVVAFFILLFIAFSIPHR
jgi:hypothetical protein